MIFDKLIDETNLRKAWIRARQYASTNLQYFDKQAYDTFEIQLEANLIALQDALAGGEYEFSHLRVFEIPKGNDSRKIYFAEPKDAVVIQAILNVLAPIFEDEFSKFVFGYRLNVYDTESKQVFKDWPEQYDKYTTQVRTILNEAAEAWYEISDFTDFYPSINDSVLKGTLVSAKHI
jgi:hypothetical protein